MSRFDNNCLWITGGLYDRFPIPVFVSEIGSYGEVRHTRAPHLENVDVADIPPDFDFVQLFHNSVHLMVYTAKLSALLGFPAIWKETIPLYLCFFLSGPEIAFY